MATQADIDILIDTYVRNFATEAFHDMQLNRILHLINQGTGTGGGGGSSPPGYFSTIFITKADFINATDCPLVALDGYHLALFYNDVQRYLYKGTDWIDLVGGGFTISIPGFDATAMASINIVVTPALV